MTTIPQHIKPGEGLNQLKLNDSLFLIVNQLKHEKINLVYSKHDYLNTPITLMIQKLGINLVFSKDKLKLIEIQVAPEGMDKDARSHKQPVGPSTSHTTNGTTNGTTNFTNSTTNSTISTTPLVPQLNYYYNNINLNHLTNGITLKLIYNKIFGPTYPGKFVNDYYLLNYPGIGFKFDLRGFNHNNEPELNLESLLNSSRDFICKEMFIFNENSFDDFLSALGGGVGSKKYERDRNGAMHGPNGGPNTEQNHEHNLAPDLASNRAPSESTVGTNFATTSPTDFHLKINLKLGLIQLLINSTSHVISIGNTTQQEILNILGPPNDSFNKFDSRLLIHNKYFKHLNLSPSQSSINTRNSFLKFNNYFDLGIDFLYDLNNSGKLIKIILYNGNLIESNHFGHWNKCNYMIYLGLNSSLSHPFNDDDYKMNSDCYFNQIPNEFFKQTTETTSTRSNGVVGHSNDDSSNSNPILLNRAESELINMDVIPINETNNWGQSKLYCYDKCIWEVLNNNCISCVTIY